MGADRPKQYIEVNGTPIIAYCLKAFLSTARIDAFIIGAAEEWRDYINSFIQKENATTPFYYSEPGETRQYSIYNALKKAKEIGYDFPNLILPSVYISPYAELGSGIVILNNAVVQNGAKIGNGTILNAGVEAHHDSTIGNYVLIYTNSVVRSNTFVGDRAWIGSTATISTGTRIAEDAIVQDGAAV